MRLNPSSWRFGGIEGPGEDLQSFLKPNPSQPGVDHLKHPAPALAAYRYGISAVKGGESPGGDGVWT